MSSVATPREKRFPNTLALGLADAPHFPSRPDPQLVNAARNYEGGIDWRPYSWFVMVQGTGVRMERGGVPVV